MSHLRVLANVEGTCKPVVKLLQCRDWVHIVSKCLSKCRMNRAGRSVSWQCMQPCMKADVVVLRTIKCQWCCAIKAFAIDGQLSASGVKRSSIAPWKRFRIATDTKSVQGVSGHADSVGCALYICARCCSDRHVATVGLPRTLLHLCTHTALTDIRGMCRLWCHWQPWRCWSSCQQLYRLYRSPGHRWTFFSCEGISPCLSCASDLL